MAGSACQRRDARAMAADAKPGYENAQMSKLWVWTAPKTIERSGGTIRFVGWRQYAPTRIPALWLRVAGLMSDLAKSRDGGWLEALREFGPLDDVLDETARDEAQLRQPWTRTIRHLDEVAMLWRNEEGGGTWALPAAPVSLARGYGRLLNELTRVAYDQVQLVTDGPSLVPQPRTLDAFFWLTAAQAVREKHRFRRCERCEGWFSVQRADARFCTASCRNWRPAPDEAAAASR